MTQRYRIVPSRSEYNVWEIEFAPRGNGWFKINKTFRSIAAAERFIDKEIEHRVKMEEFIRQNPPRIYP